MIRNIVEFWVKIRAVYIVILTVYVLLYILMVLSYSGLYLFPEILISFGLLVFQSAALAYHYRSGFGQIEKSNERLEELVAKRTEELRKTNEATRELISNISHDLRTPMTAIHGYMELLMASATIDEADMEYLEGACLRVAQMESLIDDLFLLTQLNEKKMNMRVYSMETSEFMRICEKQYQTLTENMGLTLDVQNDAECGEAMIDRDFLMRIMDNLMQNAMSYAESKIKISAKKEDDYIVFSVIDDGPGIDPETLPFIFDRFYKKRVNGSGLGLCIVKELANAMGGEVTARSYQKNSGLPANVYQMSDYALPSLDSRPIGDKEDHGIYSTEIAVKLPASG